MCPPGSNVRVRRPRPAWARKVATSNGLTCGTDICKRNLQPRARKVYDGVTNTIIAPLLPRNCAVLLMALFGLPTDSSTPGHVHTIDSRSELCSSEFAP